MHLTHIGEYKSFDADALSGTPYWVIKALKNESIQVQTLYVTPVQKLLSPFEEWIFRSKKLWLNLMSQGYLCPEYFLKRSLHIGNLLTHRLRHLETDAIISTITPLSAAFLETNVPVVYWTDSVYAALVNFYPSMRFHHADTMWDGHLIMDSCLTNSNLLIFSSQWAARTAVEFYGVNRNKIRVVPFGANLAVTHSYVDVKEMISKRSSSCIKLLFVGKNWYRKGGDIVVETAKALHNAGYPVELTLVGCEPHETFPGYIKCTNFVSKKTESNIEKLKELYQSAHFLFVPSRAEAYGIVFCEANAFGVPCIATYVGGITEIVKDGINGMTFSLEATIAEYCDYIITMMSDREKYEALALSSFNEYQTRLNWQVSAREVKRLITEII